MNFLLILSALLSAVTGAFAGAREQEPRTHQAAAALEGAVAEAVETAVSAVPAASPILASALPARAEPMALESFPIALAAPLDGVRLLE